ncbi:MAG: phytanoyl-CoA dioxygenase family protein [Gemmatimonadetes bacterium]|jgi:phytanoyl-CoA hydroxylase|nr:phytanoyl-CoA dioxygenase family protein [Gemmatimonadota bacterium]MBT7860694.1 phytanoyl-CoA dioxygenase family protein [Gemmatimonadota bacterium]
MTDATTTESPHRSLTQDQIDTFRREGYISVGKLLEDSDLEELRAEYDRAFDEARSSSKYRNLSADGGAAQRHDEGAEEEMLQIMQMCERSLAFRKVLYHEAILDIAEDLIGPNLQLFHDQALFKPARHGGPIHPHQDNAYWRCLPANLVSCWLTLDDVDVDNGAMHLLPGSHLQPAEHEHGDVLLDASGMDRDAANAVPLPAGGALFHHCQTLHFTPPNHTDRQRRAYAIHFMTPGTRTLHANQMTVGFSRPLLRGRM